MLFAVAAVVGVTVFGKLQSGGQVSSSAPSSQAEALVAAHFGGEQGLVVVGYKAPRSLEIVDKLPLSGTGKILKRDLRHKHWGDLGRQIH